MYDKTFATLDLNFDPKLQTTLTPPTSEGYAGEIVWTLYTYHTYSVQNPPWFRARARARARARVVRGFPMTTAHRILNNSVIFELQVVNFCMHHVGDHKNRMGMFKSSHADHKVPHPLIGFSIWGRTNFFKRTPRFYLLFALSRPSASTWCKNRKISSIGWGDTSINLTECLILYRSETHKSQTFSPRGSHKTKSWDLKLDVGSPVIHPHHFHESGLKSVTFTSHEACILNLQDPIRWNSGATRASGVSRKLQGWHK